MARAGGGRLSISSMLNVYHCYDYGSLAAALADALNDHPSDPATILVADSLAINANTTVPSNVALEFLPHARLKPASGVTLTLNGPVDAGAYQIFDLSAGGAVALGALAHRERLPEWWGAKGDARTVADAASTIASAAITSTTAAFTSADVGKLVAFPNAGIPAGTTIQSVADSSHATLSAAATATCSASTLAFGTDSTAAILAATACWQTGPDGTVLRFPGSAYTINGDWIANTRDRDIRGNANFTAIWQANPAKPTLVIEGNAANAAAAAGNIGVSRFIFENGSTTVPNVQVGGRSVGTGAIYRGDGNDQPVTGIRFRDCWFDFGGLYGCEIFNAADCDFSHNAHEGAAGAAYYVVSSQRINIGVTTYYSVGCCVQTDKDAHLGNCSDITVTGGSADVVLRGLVSANHVARLAVANLVGNELGRHPTLQPDQSAIYVGSDVQDAQFVNIIGRGTATIGQKLQWTVDINGGVSGPTDITLIGVNCNDPNLVQGKIREGVFAARIANAGDDTIRLNSDSNNQVMSSTLDLNTSQQQLLIRATSGASLPSLVSRETAYYSGRASLAQLPPGELVYSDPTYGTLRAPLSTLKRAEGTAAPTSGTWGVGDIVWNSAPAASGNIGWTCVTAGTPGTWKTFGSISA